MFGKGNCRNFNHVRQKLMAYRPSQTTKRDNPFTHRREPLQFLLWLGVGSSGFIFALLFALYILRQRSLNEATLSLPAVFWISTFVIIVSSITLFMACIAFKKERYKDYRLFLGSTLAMGLMFVAMQIDGWIQLFVQDNQLVNNYGLLKFIYLISGLHMLHILGGIVFLCMIFIESLRNRSYIDAYVYSVNPPNQLKIRLIEYFWHFLGLCWVFIFIGLIFLTA